MRCEMMLLMSRKQKSGMYKKYKGRGRRMCARGGGGISLPLLLVT